MQAAEARPSLHLSKRQIVGNLMPRLMCLAQRHNTVPMVSLELGTLQSLV